MTANSRLGTIQDIVREYTDQPWRSFPASAQVARRIDPGYGPKVAVDGGPVVEIRWGSSFLAYIAIQAGEVIVEGWDGRVYRASRPDSIGRMIHAIIDDYDDERMRWTTDPHGAGGTIGRSK